MLSLVISKVATAGAIAAPAKRLEAGGELISRNAFVVVVVASVLAGSTAHADIDWAKGLVTADGIGVANRAAPTPAAARGPARRLAEEAARKKLAAQVGTVPLAGGGTVGAKMKDAAMKTAVEQAVARAIVIAADPETDGSWKVTMAVPIEALRLAIAGQPRVLASSAGGDEGPAVIVVEGATNVKPALGYKVGGITAATVFVKDVPAWAKDAPRAKAKGGAKAGAIELAAPAANATEATLFVIQAK